MLTQTPDHLRLCDPVRKHRAHGQIRRSPPISPDFRSYLVPLYLCLPRVRICSLCLSDDISRLQADFLFLDSVGQPAERRKMYRRFVSVLSLERSRKPSHRRSYPLSTDTDCLGSSDEGVQETCHHRYIHVGRFVSLVNIDSLSRNFTLIRVSDLQCLCCNNRPNLLDHSIEKYCGYYLGHWRCYDLVQCRTLHWDSERVFAHDEAGSAPDIGLLGN